MEQVGGEIFAGLFFSFRQAMVFREKMLIFEG